MPPARGILIATVRSSSLSRAFHTLPKPPTPSRSISSKRPSFVERRRHPRGLALVDQAEVAAAGAASEIGERRIDGDFRRRMAIRAADFERTTRRSLMGEIGSGACGKAFHSRA